ncbi:hypothetical protein MAPG_01020 [Magnaporthiopsis poae ATCC 64411]|uniref:Uncharacterized protein n=1 Tax=Magnaporthiopsis poae (strain ATCC 64411 / 73-15) TaxID=644358 RepID=A0A0C4DML1_MAGP6|nr:hypothetical protein MAPG_01020 [Magnaporthiopsis poae ATCC 64411]
MEAEWKAYAKQQRQAMAAGNMNGTTPPADPQAGSSRAAIAAAAPENHRDAISAFGSQRPASDGASKPKKKKHGASAENGRPKNIIPTLVISSDEDDDRPVEKPPTTSSPGGKKRPKLYSETKQWNDLPPGIQLAVMKVLSSGIRKLKQVALLLNLSLVEVQEFEKLYMNEHEKVTQYVEDCENCRLRVEELRRAGEMGEAFELELEGVPGPRLAIHGNTKTHVQWGRSYLTFMGFPEFARILDGNRASMFMFEIPFEDMGEVGLEPTSLLNAEARIRDGGRHTDVPLPIPPKARRRPARRFRGARDRPRLQDRPVAVAPGILRRPDQKPSDGMRMKISKPQKAARPMGRPIAQPRPKTQSPLGQGSMGPGYDGPVGRMFVPPSAQGQPGPQGQEGQRRATPKPSVPVGQMSRPLPAQGQPAQPAQKGHRKAAPKPSAPIDRTARPLPAQGRPALQGQQGQSTQQGQRTPAPKPPVPVIVIDDGTSDDGEYQEPDDGGNSDGEDDDDYVPGSSSVKKKSLLKVPHTSYKRKRSDDSKNGEGSSSNGGSPRRKKISHPTSPSPKRPCPDGARQTAPDGVRTKPTIVVKGPIRSY